MRKDSLLVALMSLVVFGCASEQRLLDDISDQTNPDSNRIVIIASSSESKYIFEASNFHCILEKNGKCQGTRFVSCNGAAGGTTTQYEFPSSVYDECAAKLEETQFFRMESSYPKVVPGQLTNYLGGSSQFPKHSLEIHYHGRKHVVTQVGYKKIDGFDKMWLFLGDVQRRSTVVPATNYPGILNRTGAQMGGVTSDLTPAGTLTPD